MQVNDTRGIAKNDPKTIFGWTLFDFANSSYALIISTALFPTYYATITTPEVTVLGWTFSNSGLYAFSISLAYLCLVCLSPFLSGIADYGGKRKVFLNFFTIIGAVSCLMLYFFKDMSGIEAGLLSFIGASIGFAGGLVFYNAYLPDIATEDKLDRISARGFAMGYIGSVILFIFDMYMIQAYESFGFVSKGVAVRFAFVSVGIWWLVWSQVSFLLLPKDKKTPLSGKMLLKGVGEIRKVWMELKHTPMIKRFLWAYLIYIGGAQTVIYLATTFASKELHMETSELLLVVLILQLVAIGGSYFFSWVSRARGNVFSLMSMLCVWTLICVAGYLIYYKWEFYIIATLVGIVMGGIQSLSRSTYAKLIREHQGDYTSYYSFFDITTNVATVFGTFLFGFVDQMAGMRFSVLSLGLLFIIGILLLRKLKSPLLNAVS